MIKLRLDDSPCDLKSTENKKIGDAINEVLSELPPNRIFTKIDVDGRRYSSTLENNILEKTVDSDYQIEIRTADKSIWAATGYDVSLSCIERLQKSIIRSAEFFRESDKLNGNRLFIQCIEGLERFVESITITKIALNLDFTKTFCEGVSLAKIESDLQHILKSVFGFQQQEDYQGLADKIEYELLTNLSNWGQALKQLRAQQNSNA
jgi:hypothetical protein